ncbi:phytanoyl-CoA dioxygenase family protein [Sphingosinicella microcystinivorans]|uniref:Phytanoyl-CoA dioxygenase n=1 Tax=Sphingosinicella microcystinivorans TaxID=335406 RepID=A0AAD1D5J6_SPHMI|nr:phytanoyl-CoA dioxygenase family protein [Sphingosinicella microcystinivorans]RKS85424.1 ectoine hydroxylase-related dioxygenase (phytanoyl-CoA dioxygenase family) [Sphingosinicella microcystinivorans]BBE33286.1 phytanoyl-CoA dioxygenase [Sphingosinicella microcystinivorans]
MTMISDSQVAAYERDGVVHIPNPFDDRRIAELREAVDEARANPGKHARFWKTDARQSEFYEEAEVAQRSAAIRNFIDDSPAGEVAGQIMRARHAYCIYDQLFVKQAGEVVKGTDWHQDMPYMPFDGDQMCVMWMALDPVPKDNALQFLRGWHRSGQLYQFATPGHPDLSLPPVPDIDENDPEVVSFACEPGDLVIFQMRTLHGAATRTNVSGQRRALATRWVGDEAVCHLEGRLNVIRKPLPLVPGRKVAALAMTPQWSAG